MAAGAVQSYRLGIVAWAWRGREKAMAAPVRWWESGQSGQVVPWVELLPLRRPWARFERIHVALRAQLQAMAIPCKTRVAGQDKRMRSACRERTAPRLVGQSNLDVVTSMDLRCAIPGATRCRGKSATTNAYLWRQCRRIVKPSNSPQSDGQVHHELDIHGLQYRVTCRLVERRFGLLLLLFGNRGPFFRPSLETTRRLANDFHRIRR